jgi:GNAT superfamily N-acetyltransferase
MSAGEPIPSGTVTVRRAVPDDLLGMARVHVETWKSTYRGIVPDDRLDRLTVESDIAGGFGSWLKEPPPGVALFVASTPAEGIIGFALACPAREPDPDFTGELGAIYVLKSHQGRGVGSALVREVARYLMSTGTTSMIVWVLEQNPYRRFYERLGGTPVRKRLGRSRLGGGPLPEVSYGWKELRELANL